MKLRQQIREKDALIDNLLSQVNPGPVSATPLTLVPARLPLSQKERGEYRDVLAYLERAAQQAGQRVLGDGRAKFDISALEDVVSEDEDEDDEDSAMPVDGSPKSPGEGPRTAASASPERKRDRDRERAASPRGAGVDAVAAAVNAAATAPVQSILEVGAPTGMMAQEALQLGLKCGAANTTANESASEAGSTQSGGAVDAGVAGDRYFLPGLSRFYGQFLFRCSTPTIQAPRRTCSSGGSSSSARRRRTSCSRGSSRPRMRRLSSKCAFISLELGRESTRTLCLRLLLCPAYAQTLQVD